MPLINCKIFLDLSWSRNCVISEMSRKASVAGNLAANPPFLAVAAAITSSGTFQINNAKLYVPVVTLSKTITSSF